MRRRFFLVFNPTAGTSRVRAVEALIAALARAGANVERSTAKTATTARTEAGAAARDGAFDALIACGGDGTVRQVAAAASGTACAVGAFMLGTGNVLAHELGLPRQPDAVARMLLSGPTRDIRMGLANGEPFLLMAGCGLDGRIVGHLDHSLKQRMAKLAYVPAALKALAAADDDLTVTLDGHTHHNVAWAIVTSASRYGGAFRLTTRTSLTQNGLVAILFYGRGRIALIRHGLNLVRGRLDHLWHHVDSDFAIHACTSGSISSAHAAVPVQVDGDAFGTTPLTIDARGPTVSLIMPTT